MRVFLYFYYYRIYQWSKQRDEGIPMFITIVWLNITLFYNIVILASLISFVTGIDPRDILLFPRSRYVGGLWLLVMGILVWLGVKFLHVHETAFSSEMKKRYEDVGCRDLWVIAYFIASFTLMIILAWVAGARLRLH